MQYLGSGNGQDGEVLITSDTTLSPIDATCTATGGTKTISATNSSFDSGQVILIHQTKGSNEGRREYNLIDSYTAGTITTVFPLDYSYSSGAQVLVVPQISYLYVASGKFLYPKAWDPGTGLGGILAYMINGAIDIRGYISMVGRGFLGGALAAPTSPGNPGEGLGGGGGGDNASGGGGSYGSSTPASGGSNDSMPQDGYYSGDPTVAAFFLGTGGGAGSAGDSARTAGANGSAACLLNGEELIITGGILLDGANATSSASGYNRNGGGGAAGAFIYKGKTASGIDLITSAGGLGGYNSGLGGNRGGNGARGPIRIEACQITGNTNPNASISEGGHDFCQSFIHIY